MPSLKDIEARQKNLMALAEELQKEEDMSRFLGIVQKMEQAAKELESMALAFEAEMAKQESRTKGFVEVLLTQEQRTRVLKATGVSMTTVLISDPGGEMNIAMPLAHPPEIEAEAMRQAALLKTTRDAREAARMQLERELQELESQHEMMAEQVARLRENPQVKAILDPPKK